MSSLSAPVAQSSANGIAAGSHWGPNITTISWGDITASAVKIGNPSIDDDIITFV